MEKHIILEKINYSIFFEYIKYNNTEDIIMVHCDVVHWNKKIKKELMRDSYVLFSKQSKPIVALHTKNDLKHLKFITLMGFMPLIDEVTIMNGSKSMMYIWRNV